MLAHVAGIPVEEALLAAPALLAGVTVIAGYVRSAAPDDLTPVSATEKSVVPSPQVGCAVTVVTVERIVQCPPEVVFDFVARHHFENHPRWDPDVLEMSQTSSGSIGVGTTARVIRRQGRRRVEGTATVVDYTPDRRAAWDVRFGPFRLDQRAELVPEQGGAATRLRLSIDTSAQGPMRVIVPLLRGRFRKTMTQSLRTIAALLEQERP